MLEKLKVAGFDRLSKKEQAAVYNAAAIQRFKAGDTIIQEGSSGSSLFLIVEGSVEIFKGNAGAVLMLETLLPGDWMGEIGPLRDSPRAVGALAREDALLFAFNPQSFAALPPNIQFIIQKELIALAVRRFEALHARMADVAGKASGLSAYVDTLLARADDCAESEIVQNILASIPKLPPFASGLAARLLDERISANEAAEAIKSDPSLTALVLKAVNSPYYGLQEKIADINRAFIYLGTVQTYQLVMDNSLRSVMPKTEQFERLLKHSFVVSTIAHELAMQLGQKQGSSMAGTLGMLHDVGTSVILLLKRQNPKLSPLLGMLNHARLGAHLLELWRIPEAISKPVLHQLMPTYLPPSGLPADIGAPVGLLYLAHCCADRLLRVAEVELKELYFEEYLAWFGATPMPCREFLAARVIPALVKSQRSYPAWMREVVEKGGVEYS